MRRWVYRRPHDYRRPRMKPVMVPAGAPPAGTTNPLTMGSTNLLAGKLAA